MKKLFVLTSCLLIGLSSASWALPDEEIEAYAQHVRKALQDNDALALKKIRPDYRVQPMYLGIFEYTDVGALEGRDTTDSHAFLKAVADFYCGGSLDEGLTEEGAREELLSLTSADLEILKTLIRAQRDHVPSDDISREQLNSAVCAYGIMMFNRKLLPESFLSERARRELGIEDQALRVASANSATAHHAPSAQASLDELDRQSMIARFAKIPDADREALVTQLQTFLRSSRDRALYE